ncbi:MAG: FG-GAP-like repeat-containing protein [candidate division WOR-3 bacterium]
MIIWLLLSQAYWWPMFGVDLQNTHLMPGKGAMTSAPVQKWIYTGSSNDWGETGVSVWDVNRDGMPDVLSAFWSGGTDAVRGNNGTRVWATNIGDAWNSVPAIKDVNGDGVNEVYVGSWGDGNLYCLNGNTGAVLWMSPTGSSVCESSPKVADLDNDGAYEVVVGAWGGYLLCANAITGAQEWNVNLGSDIDHAPAVANLDGDPGLEVVVGSGSTLWCRDGATGAAQWSASLAGSFGWASPLIADVDNDGSLEVVASAGGILYIYSSGGTQERQVSLSSSSNSSPAAANLDADPALEIVVGSSNNIYCVDGATAAIQWTYSVGYECHRGPVIVDINGDNAPEIIVPNRGDKLLCLRGNGSLLWLYTAPTTDIHDPAVADIDGDNCHEIVVALAASSNNLLALDDQGGASGCSPVEIEDSRPRQEITFSATPNGLLVFMPEEKRITLSVYDFSGRLALRLFDGALSQGEHIFVLPDLPKGVYVGHLAHDGGAKTVKILR